MYVRVPGVREIFARKLKEYAYLTETNREVILMLFDKSVKEAHDYLLLAETEKTLRSHRD